MRNYTVFDLEMTGLAAKDNKIIEIGAVRIRDGKVADTYATLINPHVKISPIVVGLTGITDRMLAKGAEEDPSVLGLIQFIGDDMIVGHNVSFDFSFVAQWAANHKLPLALWSIDTLKLAKELVPPEQPKKLAALCRYFSIERVHAHRALDDAMETWQLFEILAQMAEDVGRKDLLEPVLLDEKRRRQAPASRRQKERLREYMYAHGIKEEIPWDTLTRSQASRKLDRYIARYGRDVPQGQRKGVGNPSVRQKNSGRHQVKSKQTGRPGKGNSMSTRKYVPREAAVKQENASPKAAAEEQDN